MLIRIDVLLFAVLLCPLTSAGVATAFFVDHPPATGMEWLGLLSFVGLPLYFAGIIAHYKIFKERGGSRGTYSRAFPVVLILLGYALGVALGIMAFRP